MEYTTFIRVLMWTLFLFTLALWALKRYVYGMYSEQATDLENNLLRLVGRFINWVLIVMALLTMTCLVYANYLDYLRTLQ